MRLKSSAVLHGKTRAQGEVSKQFPLTLERDYQNLKKVRKNLKSFLDRCYGTYLKDKVAADASIRLAWGLDALPQNRDDQDATRMPHPAERNALRPDLATVSHTLYEWYVCLMKETMGRVGFSLICCVCEV